MRLLNSGVIISKIINNFTMRNIGRFLLACVIIMICFVGGKAYSQRAPREYYVFRKNMDFGLNLGIATYMGQLSYNLGDARPGVGVYYRYNFTKWVSLKTDIQYIGAKSVDVYYGRMFNASTFNLSMRVEVNLLRGLYQVKYRDLDIYSMYLFGGIGAIETVGKYTTFKNRDINDVLSVEQYSNLGLDFIIGVGFKYQIGTSIVIGAEFMSHIVIPDNIDNFMRNGNKNISDSGVDALPYIGVTIGYRIVSGNGVTRNSGLNNRQKYSRYRNIY